MKNTQGTHPDIPNISAALARVNDIVNDINDKKRSHQAFEDLITHISFDKQVKFSSFRSKFGIVCGRSNYSNSMDSFGRRTRIIN